MIIYAIIVQPQHILPPTRFILSVLHRNTSQMGYNFMTADPLCTSCRLC